MVNFFELVPGRWVQIGFDHGKDEMAIIIERRSTYLWVTFPRLSFVRDAVALTQVVRVGNIFRIPSIKEDTTA